MLARSKRSTRPLLGEGWAFYKRRLKVAVVTLRSLLRLIAIYALSVALGSLVIQRVVSLHDERGVFVVTVYKDGTRVARKIVASEDPALIADVAPNGTVVYERVTGASPILTFAPALFAASLVSGHDGVRVTLDDKIAYVTPDDLVARQGYDHGLGVESLNMAFGADVPLIIALASRDLGARPSEVSERAHFERIRTERRVVGATPRVTITPEALTHDDVKTSILDGAGYLARGVSSDGHFRYLVDASSNKTIAGYDWPRHAGATYFLVQAASLQPAVRSAALRALNLLRTSLVNCGPNQCIGEGDMFEIGSASLGAIAFAEAVRTGLDPTALPIVSSLAKTIVSLQRADGEFKHVIGADGVAQDIQYLYFSGEATLALARAHTVTHDDDFLRGAQRGLANLVGPAWSFFGDRYYFGEEHWTCQAMGDLWDRAPNLDALDFCERWQAYGRVLQMKSGDGVWDADGGIGVGPVVTPRFTPVASRCEAGVATLDVLQKVRADRSRTDPLRSQLRRSIALMVRGQLRGQQDHLLTSPRDIYGAMPGSEVDWQLRIDYAQHAGSAMFRWLEVDVAQPR